MSTTIRLKYVQGYSVASMGYARDYLCGVLKIDWRDCRQRYDSAGYTFLTLPIELDPMQTHLLTQAVEAALVLYIGEEV